MRLRRSHLSACVLFAAGALVGCGDDGFLGIGGSSDSAAGNRCISTRDFFATEVWAPVMAGKCQACHGPGGIAQQQNAEFELQPAAYPGFLDANLAHLQTLARTENDGVSILLRKPLGELNHGGGVVLTTDSGEYRLLQELLTRLEGQESCEAQSADASFADVELLSSRDTLRKASLTLVGRLPTSAERTALSEDAEEGEGALPTLVRAMLEEEAFYQRLIEIFNDQWLTDRYLNDAQNVLSDEDFPNLDTYYEGLPEDQRLIARRSIAREPLELMAYIVRNDRPFTEIVTANYTVLNSYTAGIYNNTQLGFTGVEYAERDLREGAIFVNREGTLLPLPQAGVLTSPIFLNRYPTSPTNRNRHRARILLREFLATDILRVADRPIDPTLAVALANPTREDPACQTCHVIIDPIAGAFQKFDANDQERYRPDQEWFAEMFLPGFGDAVMQVSDYDAAPQWLGERIASDIRFPLSVVRNMYHALIGDEPREFPEDPTDGSFPAWQAQDATLRAIAEAFTASDFNLKVVIEALISSPYFRARGTTASEEARLLELGNVGTGQLLTPEQLHRKLVATIGVEWRSGNNPALLDAYRLLYGGIDSDSVTERLTTPNGIMSAIMWRMATEVSCQAVSTDFARARDSRRLFPDVDATTVPEDQLGQVDAASQEAITSNLQHLYSRLLGETLDVDGPEFERIHSLFLLTWREGRAKLASEEVARSLPGECQYRRAPGTDVDLPEDQQVTMDETYALRAWMAVITYLLADYRFLYQ